MSTKEWKTLFFLTVFTLTLVSSVLVVFFWVKRDSQNTPTIEWTKVVHNGDLIIVKKIPARSFVGKHVEIFLADQACQDPENTYWFNWGSRRVEMNCKEGRYADDDNTLSPPDEIQFVKKGVISQKM